MLNCPHCDGPGIGVWGKFFATPADPALCRYCDQASSISSAIISATTLLYFFAAFIAFGFLAVYLMRGSPSPVMILASLGMLFVAVETVKIYCVPLQALSASAVKKKQASASRFYLGAFVVFVSLTLLGKCGF